MESAARRASGWDVIVYADVTIRIAVDVGDSYADAADTPIPEQIARAIADTGFTEFLGNHMEAVEWLDHEIIEDEDTIATAADTWPRFELTLGPTRKPS